MTGKKSAFHLSWNMCLPIKFNFLVTIIIPGRCACVWGRKMPTSIFIILFELYVIKLERCVIVGIRGKCISNLFCEHVACSVCCPSTNNKRGTNRGGLNVSGCFGHWEFLKVWPECIAHNSMFPLCWKINLLWLVYIRLTNVGAHKFVQPFFTIQNCLLCFPNPSQKMNFFIELFLSWRVAFWDYARFSRQCKCWHQQPV